MNVGFNEIALYGIFALTLALGANHFGGLNIGMLNSIQELVIPTTEEIDKAWDIPSYSISNPKQEYESESPCKLAKIYGDQRVILRGKMNQARRAGNMEELRDLEEKLNDLEEREREACL